MSAQTVLGIIVCSLTALWAILIWLLCKYDD